MNDERVGADPAPVKDGQTVSAAGERALPQIAGVVLRPAVTHTDERGEVTEIMNPAWQVDEAPLVYVYQSVIRPGRVKGWIVHRKQDDRIFVSIGFARVVLFDARDGSPSRGAIDEICISERSRALVRIPRGVYHAVENIGEVDLLFVNMPSRPYDHADPDKYRLPLDSDQIPFRFDDRRGW